MSDKSKKKAGDCTMKCPDCSLKINVCRSRIISSEKPVCPGCGATLVPLEGPGEKS